MAGVAKYISLTAPSGAASTYKTQFVYRQIKAQELTRVMCAWQRRHRAVNSTYVSGKLGSLRKDKRWTLTYLSEHSGLDAFLLFLEHGTQEPCRNALEILTKSFCKIHPRSLNSLRISATSFLLWLKKKAECMFALRHPETMEGLRHFLTPYR